MRLFLAAAFCCLALGACQTPCDSTLVMDQALTFRCSDGTTLAAAFEEERLRVRQTGYPALLLTARSAGTGYRYAGGGVELRGRGGQAIWTRPGDGELTCRVAQRRA